VELNYSEKFNVKYDFSKNSISISPNESYISFYPEYITNINAIVGKNSAGKTNILDLLGIRTNDRNKNNAELEVRYKNKKHSHYLIPNDIEAVIKHSIYFFIYYLGKDRDGQDLFCFEGNDIESFRRIIKKVSENDFNYWRSKYWFAFVCNYSEGKFIYKYDFNRSEKNKSKQDKVVIISLRENLNEKYYDFDSTKPEDDYKISVPRRIAKFNSKFLAMKVNMLYEQLQKNNRLMFQDDKYTLKISYESYPLDDSNNDEKFVMQHSYKELDGREKEVCRLLESLVQSFLNSIKNYDGSDISFIQNILVESKIDDNGKPFKRNKDYYLSVIKKISNRFLKEDDIKQHIIKSYSDLADELSRNKRIKFSGDYLVIDITNKADISEILKVINVTVDEKTQSDFNELYSAFDGFFDYSIENLSDGELAYLGFFASLFEQISLLTPSKEDYIILLDEPETRMHPELTRNFINELIFFLGDLRGSKKKFQVIISTHSPFILSDIQSNNIIYLEKDNTGFGTPMKRNINTFGANIHTLLKDGFFMSSTMGEFATRMIKDIISIINDSNIKDVTEKQKNEWIYRINSIGEPLIRNKIMKLLNDKFNLTYTDLYNENLKLKVKLKKYEEPGQISETIEVLKKQIEQLQILLNGLEDKTNDKN
jgi:predicted ATP-dependent endonuclease of OLD family